MKPGNIILVRLPQPARDRSKLRPALVLATLPGPYQELLICGISTQLQDLQPDWDEMISPADVGFTHCGLQRASAIRLSYLYAAFSTEIVGSIGRIAPEQLGLLRMRLMDRLRT